MRLAGKIYGRRPGHPRYEDEEMRQFDFQRAEKSKKEWVRRRFQKPVSHLVNQMCEDTMGDLRIERCLRTLELIPAE
jgi:hypothetical protein